VSHAVSELSRSPEAAREGNDALLETVGIFGSLATFAVALGSFAALVGTRPAILVGLGVLVVIVSIELNGTLRLRFDRMNRLVGVAFVVIVGCGLVALLHR